MYGKQTLSDFHYSCVPDDPAQVRIEYYIWLNTYVYIRQHSCNPFSNTPEPDRPQKDSPAACVIGQQNSSATFVSLCFHCRTEIFGARSQKCLFSLFKNWVRRRVFVYRYIIHRHSDSVSAVYKMMPTDSKTAEGLPTEAGKSGIRINVLLASNT